MKRAFVLVPTGNDVGLTSASLGLVEALISKGYTVGFVKPVAQLERENDIEHSTALARSLYELDTPAPLKISEVVKLLTLGDERSLQDRFIELFNQVASKVDVIVIEGLVASKKLFYAKRVNRIIASSFDADIIYVAAPHRKGPEELLEAVEIEAQSARSGGGQVAGVMLNKVGQNSWDDTENNIIGHTRTRYFGNTHVEAIGQDIIEKYRQYFERSTVPLIALVPWVEGLSSPSTKDLADYLGAHALRRGEWGNRFVESVAVCSMGLSKSLYFYQDGALVVTTADRSDIVLAASMAALNGVKLAGILLCGRYEADPNMLILCQKAFSQGLPIITIGADMYSVVGKISNYHKSISINDKENAKTVFETVASTVDKEWMKQIFSAQRETRMTGTEFRTRIISSARRSPNKTIVLPEGTEPRTIKAAVIVFQRQIADPVLLGDSQEVQKVAAEQGLVLPQALRIVNPKDIAHKYVDDLVEIRKHRGLTPEQAERLLEENIWVATMMLKRGEVDGLVGGTVYTSADMVRPALQVIKMAPGFNLVSSVFFMCLPTQVLVYGGCGINQNADSGELAEVGIQRADSGAAVGLPPGVAMISYSSGASGRGSDVEKVRKATEIAKDRRPDLLLDGPMQYDAATTESVADQKMPDSPVAGRATVLVFPDLNTGNTTYKAVQRATNTISIGPMLQGLAKPVNDLSRGALVDDIIYTIAITAIQAGASAATEELEE